MKLFKRALVTTTLLLAAFAIAFTTAAVPAQAAYSPVFVCNRHTAHRGQAVACVLHHFPRHHQGTISVRARFWVHNNHRYCQRHGHHYCRHHHHHLTKNVQTRVLARFVTSRHGGRLVAFNVPLHIRKGTHSFTASVGNVSRTVRITVV